MHIHYTHADVFLRSDILLHQRLERLNTLLSFNDYIPHLFAGWFGQQLTFLFFCRCFFVISGPEWPWSKDRHGRFFIAGLVKKPQRGSPDFTSAADRFHPLVWIPQEASDLWPCSSKRGPVVSHTKTHTNKHKITYILTFNTGTHIQNSIKITHMQVYTHIHKERHHTNKYTQMHTRKHTQRNIHMHIQTRTNIDLHTHTHKHTQGLKLHDIYHCSVVLI